ncbi:anti-sigma factor family protein [Pectobacterium aroidearum]|uniref:anti-sigma factor family protein n=1 Tax=Pectobacterium aroidearum TaxID=1201031 RepID=UPI0032ED8616
MKTMRFTPPYSDEAIVAWLDGEMNEADAQQFKALLEGDEQLAERVAELMKSQLDFEAAFAPLLDKAPEARMQARLETLLTKAPTSATASSYAGVSRRSLIAASLSFLVLGSGLGYLARSPRMILSDNEKIRDLEAQYMSLYRAETLLDADSSLPTLQRGLSRATQEIGLPLNERQLTLQGAELKIVRMLRYDSTAIAQITWLHAEYGPMALCISPERQATSTALNNEQRHDMQVVWWYAHGYQFVLIGRSPVAPLTESALRLQTSLA